MPTIKDIQIQIDRMKAKGITWLIVLGVALLVGFLLMIVVFTPNRKPDDSYKKDIQRLQEKIDLLEQSNTLRDSIISQHDQKLLENRKTETIIKHHYDKISVDVPKLNNNQLRDEITNY